MSARRNILDTRHLPVLSAFASSNVLLAFDYDGTLAPIAPTPARARMRPRTRRLLMKVVQCYPCIVISGRAYVDIARRLAGIPVWYVFGNHGIESAHTPVARDSPTQVWLQRLRRQLPDDPGIVLEDKGHSLTVHYRQARHRGHAIAAIARVVGEIPDARAVPGPDAVNLLPRDGANKGVALREAQRLFACDAAIYVGDDGSDEDAFAAATPERLLAVRVGRSTTTQARYYVESQARIDQLLEALVRARPV